MAVSGLDAMIAEVRRAPAGPRTGAFFDVDGTVIAGYSAGAFYRHRARALEIGPGEAVKTLAFGLRRGEVTPERFAEFMALAVGAWRGRPEAELDALGAELFAGAIAGSLYPEAWALIAAHRRCGHTVALASSATRFQVDPLAEELGVEHVLCTPLAARDGVLTGELAGPPLWGEAKARAIGKLARRHKVDLERSFAYSNGYEDVPMLERTGRPRPLNAEPRLEREAARRGWPARRFRPRGRPGVTEVVRTAAAYGGLFTGFGVGLGLGLLNGSRRQGMDLGLTLGGEVSLALAGVAVDVHGAEHLEAARPAVFIINHQSPLDVPVMCKLLRGGFSGVAKKEAARSPIGPVFWLADVAFVERGNRDQAREALRPAVDRLRDGISLAIAPEGTRSLSPRLGPFKKGAFHVARQAEVPIVPVVMRNTGEAMWRDAKLMRAARVQVSVLPPIDVTGWAEDELDARIEGVRERYRETLEDWPREGRLAHAG